MDRNSLKNKETIQKIEYVACDLLKQLFKKPFHKKLVLRSDADEASSRLKYTTSRMGKLARDLTVLAKVKQLLENDRKATKRDLFYDDKNVYGTQATADRSITAICHLLDQTRSELNVTSCSRGFMMGSLSLINDDGDCIVSCHSSVIPISDAMLSLCPLSRARFILVVEKDATFQQMLDQKYFDLFKDSILATGRGYPDICTRKVLSWLADSLQVPILGLFDADPHGMDIYMTYRYGSEKERAETRGAKIERMQWIGVRRSDELSLPIAQHQKIPLVNVDYVRMKKMRTRAELLKEYDVVKEIDFLRSIRTKLELEAFTGGGGESDFLNRCYLVPRIKKAVEEFSFRNEHENKLKLTKNYTITKM